MNIKKTLVVPIIVGFLLIPVFSLLLQPGTPSGIRFALSAALCWFLYKGANWARWVMGVLCALGGLASVYFALEQSSAAARFIFVVLMVFYLPSAFVLLTGAHLKVQPRY